MNIQSQNPTPFRFRLGSENKLAPASRDIDFENEEQFREYAESFTEVGKAQSLVSFIARGLGTAFYNQTSSDSDPDPLTYFNRSESANTRVGIAEDTEFLYDRIPTKLNALQHSETQTGEEGRTELFTVFRGEATGEYANGYQSDRLDVDLRDIERISQDSRSFDADGNFLSATTSEITRNPDGTYTYTESVRDNRPQ